jgi:hypothetical protein
MLGCRGASSHSMDRRPEQELQVSAVEKPGKKGTDMSGLLTVVVVIAVLVLVGLALSVRIVQQ